MNHEDLLKKYKPAIEKSATLTAVEITGINHKPHPYTIGLKHVAYASDHCNGMLGDDVCRKVQCAHPGCNLPYDQHDFDVVMVLKLARNATNREIQDTLKPVIDMGMEADGIDGFVFVKNEFEVKNLKNEV